MTKQKELSNVSDMVKDRIMDILIDLNKYNFGIVNDKLVKLHKDLVQLDNITSGGYDKYLKPGKKVIIETDPDLIEENQSEIKEIKNL